MLTRRAAFQVAIIALLVACPYAAKAERPIQWKKADGGNGHWYHAVLVSERLNWVEAQLRAATPGCRWHLVTISSEAEDNFVFGLIEGKEEFFVGEADHGPWIGGFQKTSADEPGGNWRWVTNEPFDYAGWFLDEPNNSAAPGPDVSPGVFGTEEFIHYKLVNPGSEDEIFFWNDIHVNALLSGYILETELGSLGSCRSRQ
jgi:hypothetical protein